MWLCSNILFWLTSFMQKLIIEVSCWILNLLVDVQRDAVDLQAVFQPSGILDEC